MSVPGRVARSLGGWNTFLPDRLPPSVALSTTNLALAERTTHLLGQVEMCRTLLPNADLLVYSSLQREALASSTIEGTIATPEELVRYQASRTTEREPVREVANYSEALNFGCDFLQSSPISLYLVRALHETLLRGVRGETLAGRLKENQSFIGGVGEDAAFTPPPPEHTPGLMDDLLAYINASHDQPRVVQVAVAHYQFETIHPFGDGNGRVGRLLIILHLISLGLLSAPLIYPSVYFERRRSQYYDALQGVRDRGAWNEYLSYFLDGVKTQCEETISFTQTFLDLQSKMRVEVRGVRKQASINRVLGEFFKAPVLEVAQITRETGMSHNTAQSAIEELVGMGVVAEITGQRKGRLYVCKPIYDLVFPRPKGPLIEFDSVD